MKKYILAEKYVGHLAQIAALYHSRIVFEKDSETAFYFAELSDKVEIPESIPALEVQSNVEVIEEKDREIVEAQMLELTIRMRMDKKMDKEFIEKVLCQEIYKTVDDVIHRDDDV
mgnify:CR=1 FL=1